VGTSGRYHEHLVVNLGGLVEGYGLANRICIGAVGFLENILHIRQKGAKTCLKPMQFRSTTYHFLPHLSRTLQLSPGGMAHMVDIVMGLPQY
jgi:hypothetical protein